MKHCTKFCKQLIKKFQFSAYGTSQGASQSHSIKKNYKNTLVKKYIIKTLMCSNATLCQTLINPEKFSKI